MKEVIQKAVRFKNWTTQDFSHKWDSVVYTFKAGEQTYLQDYLANHFAKHLAQRECNKKNIPMTDLRFQEYVNNCLSDEISADTSLKLEMEMAKQEVKVEEKVDEKKEAMKARMAKARASKKNKPEDEFAGK